MGIIRTPLASKAFTQVPNHWLRDGRLSARAKGILAYICSHAPGYDLTVKQMVAEMKDGQDAIYAGMKELETAGYLQRDRQRAERGRLGGVDYTIVENPDDEDPTCSGFSRTGETRTGDAQSGAASSGGSVTKNNNPKNTKTKNTMKGSEVECSPSGRFAPSGADDFEDQPSLTLQAVERRPSGWVDRTPADYALFLEMLGTEQIRSTGGKAGPVGNHHAYALYQAMQKTMPDGKKRTRPGAYLEAVYRNGGETASAIDAWLVRWDLERA